MRAAALFLAALCACQPNVTYEPACFDDAGNPHGVRMNIAGTNQWVDNVRVIDDGDTCSNAEHGATAQDLADRTTHLRTGVPGLAVTHKVRVPLVPLVNNNDRFQFIASSSGGLHWNQTITSSAGGLWFALGLGTIGKITEVRARVNGAADGTHGALPVTKPKISLMKVTAAGVSSLVGELTDPSATLGAYEVMHDIALTGLNEALTTQYSYYIEIEGETGTNAAGGCFSLYNIEVTIEKV